MAARARSARARRRLRVQALLLASERERARFLARSNGRARSPRHGLRLRSGEWSRARVARSARHHRAGMLGRELRDRRLHVARARLCLPLREPPRLARLARRRRGCRVCRDARRQRRAYLARARLRAGSCSPRLVLGGGRAPRRRRGDLPRSPRGDLPRNRARARAPRGERPVSARLLRRRNARDAAARRRLPLPGVHFARSGRPRGYEPRGGGAMGPSSGR